MTSVSEYREPKANKEDISAALWIGGIGLALGMLALIGTILNIFAMPAQRLQCPEGYVERLTELQSGCFDKGSTESDRCFAFTCTEKL